MAVKKGMAVLFLVLLGLVCCLTLWNGWKKGRSFPSFNKYYQMADYAADLERYFAENIPFSDELQAASVELMRQGGEQEYNNIFIGNDILVENIGFPNQKKTQANLDGLLKLVEHSRMSTNFMLIPTKCAIKQNEVPKDAPLFNQKQFIEQTYNQILGKATAIDVYPILFSNLEQYTYYRTDPSLTSLGAYYVYQVLAQRLGNEPGSQSDFDIQHISHSFTGRTYENSPYKKITPDVLTLYRYKKNNRAYSVDHSEDYSYTYNTLYPTQLSELGGGLDVYLGGDTGDITIRSNVKNDSSLLVVGDESVLPVLPFLAVHYAQIRFVDLSKWNKEQIPEINCGDYQRLLVAYSVDTFIHSGSPAKVQYLDTRKQAG